MSCSCALFDTAIPSFGLSALHNKGSGAKTPPHFLYD
jgi:hypothetical protein